MSQVATKTAAATGMNMIVLMATTLNLATICSIKHELLFHCELLCCDAAADDEDAMK